MIKRTVDDEQQITTEALTCDQVLSIGNDGAMTDDDTLGTSSGTCGIVDVGTVRWQCTAYKIGRDLLKQRLGCIVLQRSGHRTSQMNGEIGDKEINGM